MAIVHEALPDDQNFQWLGGLKIKFWMNFFNNPFAPKTHKTKDDFTKLVELLARGVFTK